MPRIPAIQHESAPAAVQSLLSSVHKKLGMVPNIIATLAQSPAAAQAYMGFSQSLANGTISPQLREQIALAVSEANQCGYCLAAHSAIGSSVGLTDDQVQDARNASSPDRRTDVAIQFARQIVEKRGLLSDDEISEMRNAGYNDGEIVEVIANVALIMFTNYFNHVADPEIDFPAVTDLATA